jgi:rubrerythrin
MDETVLNHPWCGKIVDWSCNKCNYVLQLQYSMDSKARHPRLVPQIVDLQKGKEVHEKCPNCGAELDKPPAAPPANWLPGDEFAPPRT